MRQEHRAGEKMFVDYAGRTVAVVEDDRCHCVVVDTMDRDGGIEETTARVRSRVEAEVRALHAARNATERARAKASLGAERAQFF